MALSCIFPRWAADLDLRRTPMVGFFLIVEMTDAADKRSMAVLSRPIDCFSLSFERGKHVICIVFDHIIVDMAAFRPLGRGSI